MPLLSLITVNLNDAAGLRRTAASMAAQERQGVEWLIVDGGSRDGSLAVIREHAALIDHWSSAPDRGVYDAMNRGLRRARGEHVLFLNAGDAFAGRGAIRRIRTTLAEPPAPDLLFGGTILDLPSGVRMYRPPRPPERFLRYGLPAYHQATVFRRDAHLAVPYDLGLAVSADYGAIAALIAAGATWRLLDAPLAVRHCDPASLSERRTLARLRDFVRVQRRILARPWPEVGGNLAHTVLAFLAYVAFRDGWVPAGILNRYVTRDVTDLSIISMQ